jgi:DNA-binding SARP family transcriptional activator
MLELRTLGQLHISGEDAVGRESLLTQPKRLALLVYLAYPTPSTWHRRDTLLGMFWPERDQEHARMDLRQALTFLRRTLGEDVLRRRGTEEIGVDPDRVWCDVAAFEQAAERRDWAKAVELYRGEFLTGFFLSSEPEFEQWLDGERSRLRSAYASALERAADVAAADGDTRNAVEYCERLVEQDSYNSRHAMKLMEALVAAGDPANALLYADRHVELLRKELDVAPPAEFEALVERTRRAQPPDRITTPGRVFDDRGGEEVLPLLEPSAALGGGEASKKTVPADGVRKGRWMIAGVAVAVAVIIALTAALVALRGAEVALDPERIVVAVFRNETGDPSLDVLGRQAAHGITQGIGGAGEFVRFTPWLDALQSFRYVQGEADAGRARDVVRALAVETGSGTVISGAYYLERDSIRFQVDVVNAVSGNTLGSPEPVIGSRQETSRLVERLQQRVMGLLAITLDERYSGWAGRMGHLPAYEAYQVFDEGMELLLQNPSSRDAQQQFLRAFEIDSTFFTALMYAAVPLINAGGRPLMDSLLQVLTSHADQLSEYDRHWMRFLQAVVDSDHEGAVRLGRSLVQMAPQSRAPLMYTYLLLCLNRPRAVLDILKDTDPDRGGVRGNRIYWDRLLDAHHMLGEHVQELEVAQRARERYPEQINFLRYEAIALAALGRVDEVKHLVAEFDGVARSRTPGEALLAHGHIEAAREVFDRTVEVCRELFRESPEPQNKYRLTYALSNSGEYAEAWQIVEELVAESPENTDYVGLSGVIAARLGERQVALHISEQIGAMETNAFVGFDQRTVWQARIAAALGEYAGAVMLLQQAYRQGWLLLPEVKYFVEFAPLHDDPDFQELFRPKG